MLEKVVSLWFEAFLVNFDDDISINCLRSIALQAKIIASYLLCTHAHWQSIFVTSTCKCDSLTLATLVFRYACSDMSVSVSLALSNMTQDCATYKMCIQYSRECLNVVTPVSPPMFLLVIL